MRLRAGGPPGLLAGASPATHETHSHSRIEFVIVAVTPIAGRGAEGDRREPRPGRSGGHRGPGSTFRSSPRARWRAPDDGDSGRGQPGVPGVDVPYLDPDHHRLSGRTGPVPGDSGQSRAEEEHHPRIVRWAELPVDRQAQDVAVEAAAAVQVAGPQQDPAAQNVHATISAARGVTRQVNKNARSIAVLLAEVASRSWADCHADRGFMCCEGSRGRRRLVPGVVSSLAAGRGRRLDRIGRFRGSCAGSRWCGTSLTSPPAGSSRLTCTRAKSVSGKAPPTAPDPVAAGANKSRSPAARAAGIAPADAAPGNPAQPPR